MDHDQEEISFQTPGPIEQSSILADCVICCLAVGLIVAHCLVRSENKVFGYDEVLTAVVLHEATLSEVIDSLFDKINAMPPLYFVLAWGWTSLVGDSSLALRTFSSLFVGACWVFTWLAIRPAFGRQIGMAATCFGLLCSDDLLFYSIDARCYSMYASAALGAAMMFVWSWAARSGSRPILTAVGTALCHATLVTVHYIGFIYSAGLIAVALASILIRTGNSAIRANLIGAGIGILAGGISVPFYFAQRSLGAEDNWLTVPRVNDLYYALTFGNSSVHVILLVLCGAGLWLMICPWRMWVQTSKPVGSTVLITPIAMVWVVFTLVPVALWCESQVGIRLFLGRYFLPSVWILPVASAVLLDRFFQQQSKSVGSGPNLQVVKTITCCILIFMSIAYLSRYAKGQSKDEQEIVKIIQTLEKYDYPLVTRRLSLIMPVKFRYPDTHLLVVDQNDKTLRLPKILERRYWEGFSWTVMDLAATTGPVMMISEDFEELRKSGVLGDQWRIQESIGKLAIVNQTVTRNDNR